MRHAVHGRHRDRPSQVGALLLRSLQGSRLEVSPLFAAGGALPRTELIPCKLGHIRAIANRLRSEECEEIALLTGRPNRHVMIRMFLMSAYSRTFLVDGEIAAIGGDAAPLLASEGHLWLFTTPLVERVPLAFFRMMREEIAKQLEIRDRARSSVLASFTRCLRFYRMLGFEVVEPAV